MSKHTPNVLEPFSGAYASKDERQAYADGLRRLADWIEETRFPIPKYCVRESDWSATVDVPSAWIDDESFIRRAGSAARLIGGRVDKGQSYGGGEFTLTRHFGGGVVMRYRIAREAVCEAREEVVEEEQYVPVDDTEADALRARIEELQKELSEKPREMRKVPVTKTVFDCPPSLLAKPVEEPEVEAEFRSASPRTEVPVMLDEEIPF